MRKYEEVEVEA